MDRREFGKRAAAAAVVGMAAPMIVSVQPASAAALTSPPPVPPGQPPAIEQGEQPIEAPTQESKVEEPKVEGGTLPFTGQDVKPTAAVGLVAAAGGAVVTWWSARGKPKSI